MLNRFLKLLGRFRSDERGAFLVIFGVLAIVLVATSGAVVDFTSIEQARTRAQVALDSAALGLQPRIYDSPAPTEAQLRALAEGVLQERMTANDLDWSICAASGSSTPPCVRVESAEINITDGSLRLEAVMEVPMAFVSLVGVDSMRARLVSEATRKRLNIEVAMVLDNSGSMSSSNRMGHLKSAAICATNILLKGACNPGPANPSIENVKVGIVPFTEFVNVGTANKTAAWMDQTGLSQVAQDNFDDDDDDSTPFTGPVNRFDLYDQMNVKWKGCVEARLPPYDTNDTLPAAGTPDTLFAPALAPDEPDKSGYPNNYLDDTPAACECESGRSGPVDWDEVDWGSIDWGSIDWENIDWNNVTWEDLGLATCDLSDRELQERLCKYDGANASYSKGDGPNVDCPSSAILPLTDARSTIVSQIGSMKADGGTNIHQGVIWGFHMLSPSEPLTQGKAYDSATSKVMIVMTDGENTHDDSSNMNGSAWYTAYGYPYNGRLGEVGDSTNELQIEMDVRTKATCANAKLAGITIYTIGLSAPNQKTKDMLTACATTASHAKFPTDPTQLVDVFSEIASELANLRLAQ